MKKILVVLLALTSALSQAQTLNTYLVKFKNKAGSPYSVASPAAYLSQRAIDRRTRYGIAIDSTDFPINPNYLDSIRLAGNVTVLNASRWLNQVSIQTTDAAALAKISQFSFVEWAKAIAAKRGGGSSGTQSIETAQNSAANKTFQPTADYYDYGASYQQVHIHNGEFLHTIGLRGQSMIIGILDAGFYNYTGLQAFDSVNANGQVLGTYDFVARETSVTEDASHGMQCFSTIAANIPSQFVGTAPKASFYLFRTENVAIEYPIEEHNWVCGAERLDSAGGDVLSSSLGYSDGMNKDQFNHTYADMDGNTTIAARGADMAAKKGLLILNSAGNQGNETFHYVATPADADSVLAVGAVSANGDPAGFSSYGPSADGQVKPDAASVGIATVVQSSNNTISVSNGTSFACPNLAGLVACLWQGFTEFNNMKIITAIRQSGSKATAPDNRVGYGIPDMKKAVLFLLKDFSTATVTNSSCRNQLNWTSKDKAGMKYEIERKAPGEINFTKIAEKASAAANFSVQSYQFTDSLITVPAGAISYRIRQIIDTLDATPSGSAYIDSVAVTLAATCTTTPVTPVASIDEEYLLLPNPTHANVALRMTTPFASAALTFRVVDAKGSIVVMQKGTKVAGTTQFNFQVSHLAKGKYYLSVYKENALLATREFIKL